MASLTNSLLIDCLLVLAFLVLSIYKMWTRNYKYWEKRGVAHLKPTFPLGTLGSKLLKGKDHYGRSDQKIYNEFRNERVVGIYVLREPQLIVKDPELIKCVMTKGFGHFVNRAMIPLLKHDYLTHHLFNMEGDSWKRMRSKLSPTFTSAKMKLMFNLIEVVAQQLTDYLTPLSEESCTVEVKDIVARFTTDIIATCAFGLEVNSLQNPESRFRQIGRLIFTYRKTTLVKRNLIFFAPGLTKIFPIILSRPVVSEFILNVLKDTLKYRKENNVVRNDFIDLLTKVKENRMKEENDLQDNDGEEYINQDLPRNAVDDELTLKEMAAQMFVFFVAGFETAASTTSFCLYELAKNQEIQEKVRTEINCVIKKNGHKVTYQALQEMRYMEQCINETLRRYAPLPFLRRQCVKSFKVPDSDLVIEEGIRIVIPTYSIHHDPEYYPDPFKFDPDRFSTDNINSRHHYTFLPFGEGPRMCIGKRFGLMQVKMALTTILRDIEVKPSPYLPKQLPISSCSLITATSTPIKLQLCKKKT